MPPWNQPLAMQPPDDHPLIPEGYYLEMMELLLGRARLIVTDRVNVAALW